MIYLHSDEDEGSNQQDKLGKGVVKGDVEGDQTKRIDTDEGEVALGEIGESVKDKVLVRAEPMEVEVDAFAATGEISH